MRIRIEFNDPYLQTRCAFCDLTVHRAGGWLPRWVSEWVGNRRFWLHTRTAAHKRNRPTGELAPALQLDEEAFRHRRDQLGC